MKHIIICTEGFHRAGRRSWPTVLTSRGHVRMRNRRTTGGSAADDRRRGGQADGRPHVHDGRQTTGPRRVPVPAQHVQVK